MRDVAVIGIGMHPFGRFDNVTIGDLSRVAIWNAIKDAGIPPRKIETAYVGNSLEGLMTGQEGVRGQIIMRDAGFGGIAVINVENACASASTAFRGAWLEVAAGVRDVALAVGVEKLYCNDTRRSLKALAADSELILGRLGYQFTAQYAMWLRSYMEKHGASRDDLAQVVVKNSYNGSLNPHALYQKPMTAEEVTSSRMVAYPLTLYMCSVFSDGAAAAILCPADMASRYTDKPYAVVKACSITSGVPWFMGEDRHESIVTRAAREAYETAGVGPKDIDIAEVHAAMAPAELERYEELGFCAEGEGVRMVRERTTWINGAMPVNTSGGLVSRGHPVGATGLAQIAEIVWQLRGEAGKRQTADPRMGLVQNSGGHVGDDSAVCAVTILERRAA